MIKYGFVDVYGIAWDNNQVDFYNKLAEKSERLQSAGYDTTQVDIDRHRIYHIPLYNRSNGK